MRLCLPTILLFLVSGNCLSQINPDTVYQLPPVVIVGKAIVDEIIIRKDASTVVQVSEQQINDLNAMDLPSALRRVPGVVISRYNQVGSYGGGEGGSIYIRGKGSARPGAEIQTMVDGAPRFVGVWTHPLMDVLNVDHLERIDIYKSPEPVLWGNMSFGSLNLVSRRMHEEGTRTDISTLFGANKTYGLTFNHGGKTGDLDYYLGVSARGSDGHRPNADGQLRDYWGRIGYQFNDSWDASLILSGSDNWARDPGPVGGPVPQRARYNTNDYSVNLTVSNRGKKINGFLKLYADNGDIRWEQWSSSTNNWFNSNTDYLNRGLRLRQNLQLSAATELTVGFDYDAYGGKFVEEHADPANTKTMPEKYFFNTAGYASFSHSFTLAPGISLTPSAGVRINNHTVFDNQVAPEAGIILTGEKWNLYANYSRSYNYMGIYSVWFYNVAWPNSAGKYKDLKPERVKHYEIGLKLTPTRGTSLDFCIFRDRGEDKIRFIPPPPPPPSFANVDRFETTGFEFSLSWSPVKELSLFTGFTVLSKDPETLPYAPGYTFSMGANLRFLKRFQLNIDLEAIDEMYTVNPRFDPISQMNPDTAPKIDSYAIANAKLSYYVGNLAGSGRGASHIFLALENFTGADYEYKPGYPMPGATAFLGLTLDY